MTITEKRANKEVLIILNELNLLNQIPQDVCNNLYKNQDESWPFVYDSNLKLEEQRILRDTAVLFSTLYLMYICNDVEEKSRLKSIYEENEIKNKETYEFDTIVLKNSNENIEKTANKDIEIVEIKETLLDKILKWIKSILKFKK